MLCLQEIKKSAPEIRIIEDKGNGEMMLIQVLWGILMTFSVMEMENH